jgi:hypothetical protein
MIAKHFCFSGGERENKRKRRKKRGEGCELPEEIKIYPRKTRATEDQNQAQLSIPFSTKDGRLTRR